MFKNKKLVWDSSRVEFCLRTSIRLHSYWYKYITKIYPYAYSFKIFVLDFFGEWWVVFTTTYSATWTSSRFLAEAGRQSSCLLHCTHTIFVHMLHCTHTIFILPNWFICSEKRGLIWKKEKKNCSVKRVLFFVDSTKKWHHPFYW